jgi:hypothetical protein
MEPISDFLLQQPCPLGNQFVKGELSALGFTFDMLFQYHFN